MRLKQSANEARERVNAKKRSKAAAKEARAEANAAGPAAAARAQEGAGTSGDGAGKANTVGQVKALLRSKLSKKSRCATTLVPLGRARPRCLPL